MRSIISSFAILLVFILQSAAFSQTAQFMGTSPSVNSILQSWYEVGDAIQADYFLYGDNRNSMIPMNYDVALKIENWDSEWDSFADSNFYIPPYAHRWTVVSIGTTAMDSTEYYTEGELSFIGALLDVAFQDFAM